jgi:hypothetical protein
MRNEESSDYGGVGVGITNPLYYLHSSVDSMDMETSRKSVGTAFGREKK